MMVWQEAELAADISKTACFTGHRPSGFPFPSTDKFRTNIVKSILYLKIEEAVEQGYTAFITGMAKGVDTWCALAVINLRSTYPGLKLIGVSPYKKERGNLEGIDLWNYNLIAEASERMIYISEDYYPSCYFNRNMFMVDHSSLVIGAVSSMKSGTGNTIRYAERKGIKTDIVNINSLGEILKL